MPRISSITVTNRETDTKESRMVVLGRFGKRSFDGASEQTVKITRQPSSTWDGSRGEIRPSTAPAWSCANLSITLREQVANHVGKTHPGICHRQPLNVALVRCCLIQTPPILRVLRFCELLNISVFVSPTPTHVNFTRRCDNGNRRTLVLRQPGAGETGLQSARAYINERDDVGRLRQKEGLYFVLATLEEDIRADLAQQLTCGNLLSLTNKLIQVEELTPNRKVRRRILYARRFTNTRGTDNQYNHVASVS